MFMIMPLKTNEEKTIKINKLKKHNNLYQIYFSNNKVLLCDENTMFEYSLYLNKEIDIEIINILENKQELFEIKDKALKIINYKSYTCDQVKSKLLNHGYKVDNIDIIINELVKSNILDDERYYEEYVDFKINQGYGPLYIKNKLYELGIDKDVYIDKDIQYEILINKINKLKINKDINLIKKGFRNKMIQQGFDVSIIENALSKLVVEKDNSFLRKDYEKLLRTYQKKYDTDKLNYIIKNKLYEKGYNKDDIEAIMKGLI